MVAANRDTNELRMFACAVHPSLIMKMIDEDAQLQCDRKRSCGMRPESPGPSRRVAKSLNIAEWLDPRLTGRQGRLGCGGFL